MKMMDTIKHINDFKIDGVFARKCWDGYDRNNYYVLVEVYDDLHDIDIEKVKRIIAEIETDIRIDLYIESEDDYDWSDWDGFEI